MLECANAGMLECGNAGMLECANAGMLECANAGMLECANAGMRECGNARMRECANAGMLECANAGMLECANAGMRECGNAGMRECGNARMRECANTGMNGVEMAIVEFKKELEERTLSFSVDVLNYLFKLPSHPVFKVVIYQLAKSGSAIGANYREANRAESKPDFIHKIGIVEKESSESHYWLTILSRVDFLEKNLKPELQLLLVEAEELLKLFTTINKKSKAAK